MYLKATGYIARDIYIFCDPRYRVHIPFFPSVQKLIKEKRTGNVGFFVLPPVQNY
jgi:hypothetical protein